jgi:hypothetical protein
MKRKTLKLLKKIQAETKETECWECKYKTEYNDCMFIECPANWELPPLPEKKKMATYVKSLREIMKLAHEKKAVIDSDGNLYFPQLHDSFLHKMFQYCGKEPGGNWTWYPEWLEEREG